MRNGVVLIMLTISISLHAQNANDSLKKDIFRAKILTLDDYVTVKLTQSTDIEKLAVITPGTDIYLSPNAQSTTRISLSYRFLSVAYSFAPKFLEGNDVDAMRGKTKINSIGTSF